MFTTNLKVMFEAFDTINNIQGVEDIREISVHQNQISFLFTSTNIVYMKIIDEIEKIIYPIEIDDITLFEDSLIASCRDLTGLKPDNNDYTANPLCLFKCVINELSKTVCSCPALEFVLSDTYLKCYIDKPNIPLQDIAKLDKIFDSRGILELSGQRPYVLYVKGDAYD